MGLKWRYGENPDQTSTASGSTSSSSVIERMGYSSYFLIVWDFARFARVGADPDCTARGSACGALVSFVPGHSPMSARSSTTCCLSGSSTRAAPKRPDIDIDFCRDRRELVLNYVKEKYGHANVAQIGTFGTLKAKQAVRDVARALSVPTKRTDEIAKMIPDTLNIKLKDGAQGERRAPGRRTTADSARSKEVIDFAMALEGLAKSAGTHAAGVVIADEPLD